ncbi:MAG: UDP-N-acetyl-D-glucosamine dehydrogenase, partial [Thermotogae bacterium]|nr:UDP-N-acetyl-D-glucosamine dehydrogenase [Thermotogota bacterium]
GEINDYMPEYVVERLIEILNEKRKCLNGSKILLLGVAYKGDIDDLRESPALRVLELLEKYKADVMYYDPYIPEFTHNNKNYRSVMLDEEILRKSDAVVITTAHKKNIDYRFILDNAPLVFDTKNITKNFRNEKDEVYLL